mgnify:CR=1 FL=1
MKDIKNKSALEYQKAQDSAEHYNTMIWTLISVLLGFSLIILYRVNTDSINNQIKVVLLSIGTLSFLYFSFLIESANEKKLHKYKICKIIEKKYGFQGQNLGLENLFLSGGSTSGAGLKILRVMKLTLIFLYVASYTLIIRAAQWNFFIYLTSFIFFVAIMLSLILEIIYIGFSGLSKKAKFADAKFFKEYN